MQTTCQFFSSGIVHGGATYIGTGRGFAYRPTSFTQLYHLYGRTHLLPGAELLALLSAIGLLISFQGYGIAEYAAITWPLWIHAVSLLVAPFWFGPESFAWAKVRADWAAWARWQLSGEVDATVGASWNTWNRLAGAPWLLVVIMADCDDLKSATNSTHALTSTLISSGVCVVCASHFPSALIHPCRTQLERTRNWHGRQLGMWGLRLQGLALDVMPCLLLAFIAVMRLMQRGNTGVLLISSLGIWPLLGLLSLARARIMRQGSVARAGQCDICNA
jgi:hypothetical protein